MPRRPSSSCAAWSAACTRRCFPTGASTRPYRGSPPICPVPVTVQVEVADRPSATVEAVAYFVVAESLTNVAKHSGAAGASVTVRSESDVLRVVVRDDGRGGAGQTGAGLAGLADRVQAVDGHLSIRAPLAARP